VIVSHRHQFIHAKAQKVAGTSLELALAQHCGHDDIIADAGAFDSSVDDDSYVWPTRNAEGINSHETPAEIRRRVGDEVWSRYLKVVGIRNPWDMLVSFFYWWVNDEFRPANMASTFDRFLVWHLRSPLPSAGLQFWVMDGVLWADVYVRFESLADDVAELFGMLGFRFKGLPRLKTKRCAARSHYSAYYTDRMRDVVARRYAQVIRHFGYEFERE